jgi:hypothetical protein
MLIVPMMNEMAIATDSPRNELTCHSSSLSRDEEVWRTIAAVQTSSLTGWCSTTTNFSDVDDQDEVDHDQLTWSKRFWPLVVR